MKLIFLLLFPVAVMAQQSVVSQPESTTQSFGRHWTAAFSLAGWRSFGPVAAIAQTMRETGWASTDPGGCFFGCTGPTNFPRIRKSIGFDLDVGYRKFLRRGYQISVGLPISAEITGRSPEGVYLYLQSRIYYGSFRWAWFGAQSRLVSSVGPALLVVQDFEGGPGSRTSHHNQLRLGLHGSGQYRLINRYTWLLAAKVDARLALPASTDTYEKTTYAYSPQAQTSQQKLIRFQAKTIPTFHINVGLQLGFKFL